MTRRIKNSDALTRLFWKTDKEKIIHIMRRIPNKYLIALERRARDIRERKLGGYDDYDFDTWNKADLESGCAVKFDGCIFYDSRLSFTKEIKRRKLEV